MVVPFWRLWRKNVSTYVLVCCAGYTAYPTANKPNTRKSKYVNSEAKIKAQAFIRVDISRLWVYSIYLVGFVNIKFEVSYYV